MHKGHSCLQSFCAAVRTLAYAFWLACVRVGITFKALILNKGTENNPKSGSNLYYHKSGQNNLLSIYQQFKE